MALPPHEGDGDIEQGRTEEISDVRAGRGRQHDGQRNWHSQPELTAILSTSLSFCLSAGTRAEREDIALSQSSLRRILLEVG